MFMENYVVGSVECLSVNTIVDCSLFSRIFIRSLNARIESRTVDEKGLGRDISATNTGAMLYQLSCEATHWERGQFIEFIFSRAVK